jgi:hypothetical protein
MSFNKVFGALLLAASFISCQKDEMDTIVKDKIDGYVQKGPYINGTSITISELNPLLIPTGRNFNTQIVDNKGSFQINDVTLSSQFVELKADGFYFNEVTGTPSSAPLTLYALTDVSDKSSVNVNVRSYLEKSRIEYLIGQGENFAEAKKQVQQEVLSIFEIQKEGISSSETLDLSQSGDDNAILLASSVILQGKRTVAELSELLANISIDIKEDGILNDATLGQKLINDTKYLDLAKIRQNIELRYVELGVTASIPDFEKYVRNFINSTSYEYTYGSFYPATGAHGTNVLNLESGSIISASATYSFSAEVPSGSSLTVVVKGINGLWYTGSNVHGWQVGNFDTQAYTQTFTALKTGEIIDLNFAFSDGGSCLIEFYENGSPQPSTVKTIYWEQPETNTSSYPSSGSYGYNILSMASDSTIVANQYSLTMSIPAHEEYAGEIKLIFEGSGSYTIDPTNVQNWQYTQTDNQLVLSYPKGVDTADMSILLSGEGKITIQSIDLNKIIHWK